MGNIAERIGRPPENAVLLRPEEAKDYPAVYAVIKAAFARAAHADGNEQDLASALRQSDAYIPELALVAEAGGRIVGHILFTKAVIAGSVQLEHFNIGFINSTFVFSAWIDKQLVGCVRVLSDLHFRSIIYDLAVLPEYQRRGVGSALIREGHRRARELGYGYSIVLGSETYYPRMGYVPAKNFGIVPPFAVADENFMACKLREDAPAISGVVQYAKEFGIP